MHSQYNLQRYYPAWGSLAQDYLAIMSSSVSSECSFSQGGITISKWHNRFKGDIVEALQCIKCAIRHDLLFQEKAPASKLEEAMEAEESSDQELNEDAEESDIEDMGWDSLLIEDEDMYSESK